jgi:hypothetical protein
MKLENRYNKPTRDIADGLRNGILRIKWIENQVLL